MVKMTYSSEKFCLKWNDFQQNLVSSFHYLRKNSDFSDVTLVCEEDQKIEAHRIILSACSPFFSRVLKRTKQPNPIIYMRGLKAKDLVAIVDFIYHGEANIYQEDLDGFLALADELQLKGLAGSYNEYPETVEQQPQTSKIPKKETHEKTYQTQNKVTLQNNALKYNVNQSPRENRESSYDLVAAEADKMLVNADMDNLKVQINSMMQRVADNDGENKWRCTVCAKVIKGQRDMGRHIETHIEGVSYPCNLCGAVKRSSNALNIHMTRDHRS